MNTVGLFVLKNIHNIGDEVLASISSKILRDVYPDIRIQEIEFQANTVQLIKKGYFFQQLLAVPLLGILKFIKDSNLKFRILEVAYRIRYRSYYRHELQHVSAIIFGIGVVKYSTQHFSYPYSIISDIAEKNKIPMMVWSQTIEPYRAGDYRAEQIKAFLNNPMLKMISTRDAEPGLRRLKEYLQRSDEYLEAVGDRALLIPRYYHITVNKTQTIGINLIRGNIYTDYRPESNMHEAALLTFYRELLCELDLRGLSWELFTNGMSSDKKFGDALIESMDKKGEITVFEPRNEKDYINHIASYQAVFGARFHACLIAYALNVPVIGLAWDPKFEGLGLLTGKPELFLTEEQLDKKKIADLLQSIIDMKWDYSERELEKERILNTAKKFLTQYV